MASRKKKKFYVVWKGRTPGVYRSWEECQAMVKGYSNARFESFTSLKWAEKAYREGPPKYRDKNQIPAPPDDERRTAVGNPVDNSLCVDAACNMKTEVMEYRGVWNHDRSLAFQQGPFPGATNNIGEFLALVHALAFMTQREIDWPVYSDSQTAISWVRKGKANSKFMREGRSSPKINALVSRAVKWLHENEYSNKILKWETEAWGEVPADFGRK